MPIPAKGVPIAIPKNKAKKALCGAGPAEKALAFTMVLLKALAVKYAARRSEW